MPRRLLIEHFLRRLLDNDLITPGTDRHQVLSVTVAALISAGAFLTVAFSMKYLFSPIQSPGETALVTLDDVCLMSGLSMTVMALVAVAEWDALSLDARDAAILGPLPVPARELASAQLAALALFASVFALTLNGLPSVLMPLIRLSRLGVGFSTILRLMAAQAVATTAAGVLGFAAVMALRETLRVVAGDRWFSRLAALVQSALVVIIAIAFLGLPTQSVRVQRRWAAPGVSSHVVPPAVWFAGGYDRLGGRRLEQMPPTLPPRDAPTFDSILEFERTEAARYAQARARLAALGSVGARVLLVVCLVALTAWGWNNRRLPQAVPASAGRRRRRGLRGMERALSRHQVSRAAIRFTLQTLSRGAQHRVVGAASVGIAAALAMAGLRSLDPGAIRDVGQLPLGALAAQLFVLVAIGAGFRQACRMPAGIRATPSFLLAWNGDHHAFVAGVRRAGFLYGAAAVAMMMPLHVFLLGPRVAAWHATFGVLVVGIITGLLFTDRRRLPLVSEHESGGNLIGLAPIYLVIVLAVVFATAWVEREALHDTESSVTFGATLALLWAGLSLARRWRGTPDANDTWTEAPAWETERLSLTE